MLVRFWVGPLYVCFWHLADILNALTDVCFWGQDVGLLTHLDL